MTGELIRLKSGSKADALVRICRAADDFKAEQINAAQIVLIVGDELGMDEPPLEDTSGKAGAAERGGCPVEVAQSPSEKPATSLPAHLLGPERSEGPLPSTEETTGLRMQAETHAANRGFFASGTGRADPGDSGSTEDA